LKQSDENFYWASAATLMTLSVSLRCAKDFRYYRNQQSITVEREKLESLCRQIRHHLFSLHNVMLNEITPSVYPFLFLLGRSIHDDLETLHRDLLFFEADDLVDVIPLIDHERNRWKSYNQADFYDEELSSQLDHQIPSNLDNILAHIRSLPPIADSR
jgi:hypothetical protein